MYAVWTANEYTLTYNANGVSGAPAKQNWTYGGTDIILSSKILTRTGYTFLGWAESSTATTAEFDSGSTISSTKWSTNKTLYAVWKANTYTIVFDGNGHTGGSMSTQEVTYDVETALISQNYRRTGYTFQGWSLDKNATSATYKNKAPVKNLTDANNGTVTLYAVWKINTYTVTFENYDGTVLQTSQVEYGNMPTYNYNTSPNVTRPADNEFTYEFIGWDKQFEPVTGAVTYVAQYTKQNIIYDITFADENGNVYGTQPYYYGQTPSYSNPTKADDLLHWYDGTEAKTSVRAKYTFVGWTTEPGSTTASGVATVKGNTTYYAVFKENVQKATITVVGKLLKGNIVNGTQQIKEVTLKTVTVDIGSVYTYNARTYVDDTEKDSEGNSLKYPAQTTKVSTLVTGNKTIYVNYARYNANSTITAATSYHSGDGTEANPYMIMGLSHLVKFKEDVEAGRDSVNGKPVYYKIGKSMDSVDMISGFMINAAFDGVLDGNNCKIDGLSINSNERYVGLFSQIGITGVVKNLIVTGSVTSTYDFVWTPDEPSTTDPYYAAKKALYDTAVNSTGAVGAIAGIILGTSDESKGGQIINCTSYVTISNPTCNFAGGIVGYAGQNSLIDGCNNYGTVDRWGNNNDIPAYANAGGITSIIVGKITNCNNYGTVKGNTSVGGIAGGAYHSSQLISNCNNYGEVIGGQWNIGGIIGLSNAKTTQYCANYGNVSSQTGYKYISSNACSYKVDGNGNVTLEYDRTLKQGGLGGYVGGITGTDTGNIHASDVTYEGINYKKNTVNGLIDHCVNEGTVSGKDHVAGIVGSTPSKVTNCINSGDITGTQGYVAGIVAVSYTSNTTSTAIVQPISDCINYGDITGTGDFIAGIVGLNGNAFENNGTYYAIAGGDVSRCKNYGTIQGNIRVAGIVGANTISINNKNTIVISGDVIDSENYGKILGSYNSGGIVGETRSDVINSINKGTIVSIKPSADTNATHLGGVVGSQLAGNIKSSTNYGLIDCSTTWGAGGIAGSFDGTSIEGCNNHGIVIALGQAGGIVGKAGGTIKDSNNYGSINASGGAIGGIVGDATHANVIINNCDNAGRVTGKTDNIGGILGLGTKEYQITDCENTGNISGRSNIGGIVGGANVNTSTIKNSKNSGIISGTSLAGGIIGKSAGTIEDCTNSGKVTVQGNGAGGIVGQASGITTIKNSDNIGAIKGTDQVGGILGDSVTTKVDISGCDNTGSVYGRNNIGGIVGQIKYVGGAAHTVTNCTNAGEVTGTGYIIGGLVGAIDQTTVENCTNLEAGKIVTMIDAAGGLAGAVYKTSRVENCTNHADITGSTKIAGVVYANSGVMKDCTNYGDMYLTSRSGVASPIETLPEAAQNTGNGTETNCTNQGKIYDYQGNEVK